MQYNWDCGCLEWWYQCYEFDQLQDKTCVKIAAGAVPVCQSLKQGGRGRWGGGQHCLIPPQSSCCCERSKYPPLYIHLEINGLMPVSFHWQQEQTCESVWVSQNAVFRGLLSFGINSPWKGLYEKSGNKTKQKNFFIFSTLCPLCIPDTGFWNSWLMLLVFLLCCLLFSEGCCWKEDYIIMQIRLYNPEQMVHERGGTGKPD